MAGPIHCQAVYPSVQERREMIGRLRALAERVRARPAINEAKADAMFEYRAHSVLNRWIAAATEAARGGSGEADACRISLSRTHEILGMCC